MMLTLQQVVQEISVTRSEVTEWIDQSWVLPIEEDGELLFDDVDCARIRLIMELRRDLEVNDEAIPVVLRLLDQIYSLRRTLEDLREGIKELSEPAREELETRLQESQKGSRPGPD